MEKLVDGVVPVRFFTYLAALDNLSIPILTNTKSYREQIERSMRPEDEIEAEAKKTEQRITEMLKAYQG